MEVDDLTAMRIAEAIGKALGDQSAVAGREGRRPTASLAEADYEKAEQPNARTSTIKRRSVATGMRRRLRRSATGALNR
jgi:hypothetical protein